MIISQTACSGKTAPGQPSAASDLSRGEAWLLNTYCSITVYETGREQLIEDAFTYASSLEKMLSRTVSGSYVSRFNAAEKEGESTPELNELVLLAREYYELSGGLFDISIGPVSKLWDFQSDDPQVPDASAIAEGLKHTQKTGEITVFDYRLQSSQSDAPSRPVLLKKDPGIEIDLGGIAKGYIADKTRAFLEEQGVSTAIINFGGNVITLGSKPDGSPWRVAIERPFSGEEDVLIDERSYVGVVETAGASVVTSGTYERKFYGEDGTLYHHVLDPRTGYPVQTDLMSATVIGPESARCDALSTSCLLMGSETARTFMEGTDGYEYVLILNTGEIVASGGAGFTETK